MPSSQPSLLETSPDPALDEVRDFLLAKPDLAETIGNGLRQSFDEVIDGPRTGRYRIEQLEKTEKTYIGTKVEIVLRVELELERGAVLDNLIGGHEVDTKFSLEGGWMIPREAIGHVCILVRGSDRAGQFSVGLLRATPEVLTKGSNQDKKKNVSAAGKKRITWLILNEPMPRNFLLDLDDATRERVMSPKSGMQRVRALFKNVTGQIIPRTAIEQLARQKDPLRRARQMKEPLAAEGFQILCATYEADRSEFRRHGFSDFREDDWLSIPLT
jgi:hypothetical protein